MDWDRDVRRINFWPWEFEGICSLSDGNWRQLRDARCKQKDGTSLATELSKLEMRRSKLSEVAVMRVADKAWTGLPNRKGSNECDVGGFIEVRNMLFPYDGIRIDSRDKGSLYVATYGPIGASIDVYGWITRDRVKELSRGRRNFTIPLDELNDASNLYEVIQQMSPGPLKEDMEWRTEMVPMEELERQRWYRQEMELRRAQKKSSGQW